MREMSIRVEGVSVSLCNIKRGSEISPAKHSAFIAVNGRLFPMILRDRLRGGFRDLEVTGMNGELCIHMFKQPKNSIYTKNGYATLLVGYTVPNVRSFDFWFYIKEKFLHNFFAAVLLAGAGK